MCTGLEDYSLCALDWKTTLHWKPLDGYSPLGNHWKTTLDVHVTTDSTDGKKCRPLQTGGHHFPVNNATMKIF